MNLSEVLQNHLGGNQQGQLVIKLNGENHLCKISVEKGQAVYLSLGTLGPVDTLNFLSGKAVEWVNFIENLPVRKRLEHPVNDQLLKIAGAAPAESPPATQPATTSGSFDTGATRIEVGQINRVMDHFIDHVGPLGTLLAQKIATRLSCSYQEPMESATFKSFVAALAEELPEDERQGFISALNT
jgi:hypothetical protein